MTAIRFYNTNYIDWSVSATTLTASSEVATLPVENVLYELRTKVWRSTNDTDENIVADLGSAKSVTAAIFVNHNWTSGGTYTLQAHTSDSWGAPAYSQALTHHADVIIFHLSQTYRYWRIRIQDGSNPDGYVELGRWFLGTYVEPSANFRYDWTEDVIDTSVIRMTRASAEQISAKPMYRLFGISFTHSTTDFDNVKAIVDAKGTSNRMFIAFDWDNEPNDYTIYGRFLQLPGIVRQTDTIRQYGMSFKEDV